MIVKNEAHIIRRTLAMLCSKIRFDYWVICDTGSTDATPDIIQDFFLQARVNIPGELHCDAWVNFAHNRTLALNYAFGKTDLLLVFDADDDICGAIALPSAVTHDEYQLKFGSPRGGGVSYVRTLLINNRKRFKYFSVVHEYISCLEPSAQNQTRVLDGDYCVVSGRGGARNRDPDKYLKDALLLEAAHAEAVQTEDPLYKRYAFYCANSYRDCGQPEDAIRWYKVTLSQDNWAQEKYLACLHLYRCYESLGQKEHGFYYLVKAFAYDAERVECLHPLVVHYCCEGMNEVAYGYYRMVQAHYEGATLATGSGESKLFFEPDKANFFLPYYMIIVADRVGDRACGIRMYEIIFTKKEPVLSAWHLKNLVFNLRFFIGHVKPDALAAFVAQANEYLHTCGVSPGAFADVSKDFNYAKWGIVVNANAIVKPVISPNFSRSECEGSKAILFYAGYSDAPWNYSSMLRGALGGSERAVANLSRELYLQGYTVYVSGGVLEDDAGVGVKYVGLSGLPELLRTTAFHTIVCSRYVSFLELHGVIASWYRFYVWAHDTHLLAYGCDLSDTAIIEKWSDLIDVCVCQTRWHADEYAHRYPTLQPKLRVINNGIDAALFPVCPQKVPGRFIYTSRTERGLSRILDLWPDIIAAMPDATLVISTYVAFPCNDDERRIQARIAGLNQIEGEAGGRIRHLGRLNHEKLYAEMGAAEYWLYPTDWPETSCITAMEMLMSGVICLYYPVAGLTETMGGCGIQVAPGSEVDALINIAKHDEPEKEGLRQRGRAYAESCGWAIRAQQWVRAMRNGPTLKIKTVVINLKRRRDRRVNMEARLQAQTITDYEFMDAVDGNRLILTEDIRALFKGNDFNYRKGVIGCAMSHLALWKRLMDDSGSEVYAIMEDDAELVDNFEVKLGQAVRLFMDEPSAELCFISTNCLNSVKSACNNWAGMRVIKKNNKEVDGLGGYLIKKSGAIRFIEYYNTHSMTRAIDASIIDNFNDRLYEVNEYLIKSVDSTDTDVQESARPTTVAFCDWWDAEYGGGTFDVNDNFFVNLLKQYSGSEIKLVKPSQTPDILFYSVFGQSNGAYRAGRKVFFAGEPVPHRPNADFNITFDASNAVNARLPLWVCYFDDAILKPRQFSHSFKREKFCSYIATQPGFENNRQLFVERLSAQYKRVDCGGKHLNNIGGAIPPGVNASGKIEHNKQYKFAIAFENRQYPGYVTEKICDAYKSGCIPIYWGTPDVTQDFTPGTFINANDFADFDALIDHIRRVDCDDELYASYFKDPILSDAWMHVFADPTRAFFKRLVSNILKA
jgi:GR25 family glycosyltransferase involved in LPS biosynthesis/glycosyltransferase involved in cell wall biosynthesis